MRHQVVVAESLRKIAEEDQQTNKQTKEEEARPRRKNHKATRNLKSAICEFAGESVVVICVS